MAYANRSKSAQQRSGVFISYARSDGEAFAHRLRERLEKQNIKLWQDRVGMEGGRDWWLQITEALDNVAFMALVVTPNALKSEIVRKEWRYARQQGVCVYPIKGAPNLDFNSMPRWMRDLAFYDIGSLEGKSFSPEWQKFLNDLNKTPDVRRVPFMVEDLPAGFVQRPHEFDQLFALLLDQNREEPVAITAALRGAGGYGKTTIAKALCHNDRIQDAFDDGILWVTLGENPGDMTGRVEDLIQTLSDERPGFSNTEAAIARLKELLADRDLLIVIDDVWNRDHPRPFMQGGPRCARLITTRNLDTLPTNAHTVKVDAMRPAEAIEMLRAGLPAPGLAECVDQLRRLATRLGEWPLLLGLVNGALQDRVNNANQPLPDAIAYINLALDKRGLTFFDTRDTESGIQAVAKTIGVSLELLKPAERARYAELAVFPEDSNIPLATLEKFWGKTGEADGFDAEFDTETLCSRLNQFSLLHSFDLGARTIRLHDVIRAFLRDERKTDLPALNNQLLDAHRPDSGWAELPDDEPYLWDHLAGHLIEAGRGEEMASTVKDWRYVAKKIFLRKSHAVENDLLKAEKIAPADDSLRTLRRGISVSSHLINHSDNPRDIKSTLLARLHHLADLTAMLQDLAQNLSRPYVTPHSVLPDLPHPALIRTLEGHSYSVNGCAFSPDGKLIVSASSDRTLKVWDAQTGQMLRSLEGHSDFVHGCAFSSNGKLIVSASSDYILKVWDAQTGQTLRSLVGHSYSVNGCAFSPDGKLIVSASWDSTFKVWDAQTGQMLRTLEGHSDRVNGCAFSPDGKLIVSASWDSTLKVWDAQTGQTLYMLEGHSDYVNDCAFSPDGRLIVSTSLDRTLKVWDALSGQMLRTLEGHSDQVNGCAFSPDGKLIVSASADRTLKVWDAQTGQTLYMLEGHSDYVNDCAFSPDGMLIVSTSLDRTLKVWDALRGQMLRSLVGHSESVYGRAFSPDGKLIVSASWDSTLKVWDAQTGQTLRTLEGHSDRVNGCAFSPDGKLIVSASWDSTLKVWDAQTGQTLYMLEGHSDCVNDCAFSPDGRLIVSASADRTLKVWHAETGQTLATFFADGPMLCCAVYGEMIAAGGARGAYFLRLVR